MIVSNIDTTSLLCSSVVTITGDHQEKYFMRLPTLQDAKEDINYSIFLGFCGSDLQRLSSELNYPFQSRHEVYLFYKRNNAKDMLQILHSEFGKYMIDFKYVDERLYWNDHLIPWRVLDFFCDYFAIAAGTKDLDELDLVIQDDMDEFEKMRIKNEIRIRSVKKKDKASMPSVQLAMVLAAVAHEFGYPMSELYKMTMGGINFLYSLTPKIMNHQISEIAIGNGNVKKNSTHYYWADPRNK